MDSTGDCLEATPAFSRIQFQLEWEAGERLGITHDLLRPSSCQFQIKREQNELTLQGASRPKLFLAIKYEKEMP